MSDQTEPKDLGGRPEIYPGEKMTTITFRATAEQKAKVALYGHQWLRDLVEAGKPPKGWKPKK